MSRRNKRPPRDGGRSAPGRLRDAPRHEPERQARQGSPHDHEDAKRARAQAASHGNVAYGIHVVRALLTRHPHRVRRVWLGESRETSARLRELRTMALAAGLDVQATDDAGLDRLAGGERHQGAVVEVTPRAGDPETQLEEALEALGDTPGLLLVLDGVTDPHNLGACLRSADAAGVAAVIVPRDRAAGLTPIVRKVAAGAAESVPLVAVVNLARTLRELKERGLWLVGTADEASRTLYDVDLTGPTVLVLGSEGEGMRRLTREACDELVSIPMSGAVESLNVSVATGVALFEAVRQRRALALK
jgi:23S rRNA (guanosine2251-2'-O)-methyltransferase